MESSSRGRKWASSAKQNQSEPSRRKLPRPVTAIPSRPPSRGPHDVTSTVMSNSTERPRSAVRPLSANIFMRRSSTHGWVAKAYPGAHSSTNLDLDDDNLHSESFDSFFDEEFEEEGKTENLENLLACNTLGVEKKAVKQDWISGEIDIPHFHCPRCRDHWYGIRSEPCDEELARLIREGLWGTGNTATENHMTKIRDASSRSTKGSSREIHSYNESSSKTKLPSLKSRFHLNKRDEGNSSWHLKKQEDEEQQKKKKRITFDVDDDDDVGEESASQLLVGDGVVSGATRWSKGEGWRNGGDGAATGGREVVTGGMRSEEGTGNTYGGDGGEDVGVEGREHSAEGGDSGDMKGNKGNSKKGDDNTLLGGDSAMDRHLKGQGAAGQRTVFAGKVGGQRGLGGDEEGLATATRSSGLGSDQGALVGGKTGEVRNSGQDMGQSQDMWQGQGLEDVTSEVDRAQLGRERSGSHRAGKSGGVGGATGDDDTTSKAAAFLKPTDHGKRIRKSGGYMRAVSPTSSEWGDPLHARSFLSSTAASQMGSSSDLTGDTDNTPPDDPAAAGNSRRFLPPIVHPIPPPAVSIHFMSGPEITRPWTFSYH